MNFRLFKSIFQNISYFHTAINASLSCQTIFQSYFFSFLFLSNSAFSIQANAAEVTSIDMQNSEDFLSKVFEDSFFTQTENMQNLQYAQSKTSESMATLYPQIAASGGSNASQTKTYADSKALNTSEKWKIDSNARIALTQNIYKSGLDVLNIEKSDKEFERTKLLLEQEKEKYLLSAFLNLAELVNKELELEIRKKQNVQSIQLAENTNRKSKSGLLNSTDVLRVQQEVQKNDAELLLASKQFASALKLFSNNYAIKTEVLKEDIIPKFKEFQSTKFKPQLTLQTESNILDSRIKIAQKETELSEIDLQLQAKQKFLTSVDFNLGYSANWNDKVNVKGNSYPFSPSKAFTPFASLDFKTTLFQRSAWQAEESAKLKTALQNKKLQLSLLQSSNQLAKILDNQSIALTSVQNTAKILATEAKIFDKINRLFLAGEVNVETLLNSQKALNETEILSTRQNKELSVQNLKHYFAASKGIYVE